MVHINIPTTENLIKLVRENAGLQGEIVESRLPFGWGNKEITQDPRFSPSVDSAYTTINRIREFYGDDPTKTYKALGNEYKNHSGEVASSLHRNLGIDQTDIHSVHGNSQSIGSAISSLAAQPLKEAYKDVTLQVYNDHSKTINKVKIGNYIVDEMADIGDHHSPNKSEARRQLRAQTDDLFAADQELRPIPTINLQRYNQPSSSIESGASKQPVIPEIHNDLKKALASAEHKDGHDLGNFPSPNGGMASKVKELG